MRADNLQRELCAAAHLTGAGERTACENCPVREFSLCKRLNRTSLAQLRALATHHRVPQDKLIFEQGSHLKQLHILTAGTVKLYHLMANGKRQIIGFLGPGDLLGGIKQRDLAFCTAMTMTSVELCSFTRQHFFAFLQDHPDLCLTLLAVATDEIEAQYEHTILLARKQAPERVAAMLLLLALRWPGASSEPNTVRLPMPRSDIADYLGLTIETVSRVLARLRDQGLIEFRGPKIVVLKNLAAINHLAGFEEHPRPRTAIGL